MAAVVRDDRPVILIIVAAGFGALVARRRRASPAGDAAGFRADGTLLAWAAAIPVAASLAWGGLPAPAIPSNAISCSNPLSPHAVWRVGEAIVVLATLGATARLVGAGPASLGLRRPSRGVALVAVAGSLIAGPIALFVGPALARPFFGPIQLANTDPAAIVIALAFAVANGSMEELAYRGALLDNAWPGSAARTCRPGHHLRIGAPGSRLRRFAAPGPRGHDHRRADRRMAGGSDRQPGHPARHACRTRHPALLRLRLSTDRLIRPRKAP